MKIFNLLTVILAFTFSSIKGQTIEHNNPQLLIKTIIAKGSLSENEFGNQADWIEIYNEGETSVDLGENKWFITDNPKRQKKYRLPKQIIAPKKSIIIWCDDENRVKKQIHANFKLSSYGETLVLSCRYQDEILIVDSVSYNPLDMDNQMAICRTEKGLVYKQLNTDREGN